MSSTQSDYPALNAYGNMLYRQYLEEIGEIPKTTQTETTSVPKTTGVQKTKKTNPNSRWEFKSITQKWIQFLQDCEDFHGYETTNEQAVLTRYGVEYTVKFDLAFDQCYVNNGTNIDEPEITHISRSDGKEITEGTKKYIGYLIYRKYEFLCREAKI